MKPTEPMIAKLTCGCRAGFRDGVDGSPVTVVILEKSAACGVPSHVTSMPVYDHRDARRPATRLLPEVQTDYEN